MIITGYRILESSHKGANIVRDQIDTASKSIKSLVTHQKEFLKYISDFIIHHSPIDVLITANFNEYIESK